jgi:hypothetical protein
MKSLMSLCIVGALALSFAQAAVAEDVWSCSYTGEWTTEGTNDHGDFKWLVKWERPDEKASWHIIGDYNDRFGASFLDGNCNTEKKCDMTQTYTSGSLNGSVYEWSGTYTDKADASGTAGKTTNTFTGTWKDASGKGNKGKWTAEAVCTKQ